MHFAQLPWCSPEMCPSKLSTIGVTFGTFLVMVVITALLISIILLANDINK